MAKAGKLPYKASLPFVFSFVTPHSKIKNGRSCNACLSNQVVPE